MHNRSVVIAFVIAGCTSSSFDNDSGHLAATKLGDTSHPAERSSPVDDVRAACGNGGTTSAGTMIKRAPYVQNVTTTGATLGWVTMRDTPDEVVTYANTTAVALATQEMTRDASEVQRWASLSGFTAGSINCYEVDDTNGVVVGRTGFRSAPAADSTAPVRFLAFGDSGGDGSDQYALLEQMYTVPYDLMVHTGDLAYDNGTIDQIEDTVFAVYNDLLRNIPLFPAAGNHDYETMQGAPFRDVFDLPSAGDGQPNEKWYSYDWGRVHFVALDTEADYATQAKWLDNDLAATDRPWKIIYLHRPPYSSGEHGSDTDLRAKLAPVLAKHHVQLVLAGHDHSYERIAPQDGTHYVVTGGGGVGTRPVGTSSFTEFSEQVIHFVYVEVLADEAILHAIDATGVEFDSVVIPRDNRG